MAAILKIVVILNLKMSQMNSFTDNPIFHVLYDFVSAVLGKLLQFAILLVAIVKMAPVCAIGPVTFATS